MGIVDKLKAIFQVGTDKMMDNAGLNTFGHEVKLKEADILLANSKKELVNLKILKNENEKKLANTISDIKKIEAHIQNSVNFFKDENNSEADRERVKEEAKPSFVRLSEKEAIRTKQREDINKIDQDIAKSEEIIQKVTNIIENSKKESKDMIHRNKNADAQNALAISLESLLASSDGLSSKLEESVITAEASAEVRMNEVFDKLKKNEEPLVEQLTKNKDIEDKFENAFK